MAGAASGDAVGTATMSRPSVAEIKARIAQGGIPGDDSPRDRAMRSRAELLKPIAGFVYRALQVGVLLVAAGTILGGVWADYSWGRFWGWDPKEVSALITLLVYLVPLHGRFAGWINPFGMICASVLCFNSVLMAWYGVNFLLGVGLHSYGFAEGGQGAVLLSALVVSSISFGAIWRRSLARREGSERRLTEPTSDELHRPVDPPRANGDRRAVSRAPESSDVPDSTPAPLVLVNAVGDDAGPVDARPPGCKRSPERDGHARSPMSRPPSPARPRRRS